MRPNAFKSLVGERRSARGAWLSIPSSVSAEIIASQGWDVCTVDMQHGAIDYSAAVPMLQAISSTDAVPFVRVPWNEAGIIMKSLDAGAYGIICPMVNSRADAERLVTAARFPPLGERSVGPLRGALHARVDYAQYVAHANDTIVLFAMIETQRALDALEEIASTPGLDGLYIGPADLSLSVTGRYAVDHTEPPLSTAIERIRDVARAHGLAAGVHCTAGRDYARKMIAAGFDLVTVGADAVILNRFGREALAEIAT